MQAMKHTRMSLAALALAALISPAGASTLLFFDDFNADVQNDDAEELLNWTVTNGRVGVHGPGSFDDYPGNGNYIDMDGSSANAGKITTKQLLTLVPGVVYTLSFDLGKSRNSPGPERLSFGIGGWEDEIRLPPPAIPSLLRMSYDFTVTATSGNLWFNAFGGDNAGPIIDDVNLEVKVPLPTTVPLPASGVALIGGLAGLWLMGTRRRRIRPADPAQSPATGR